MKSEFSNLYERDYYTTSASYIIAPIFEYDIQKANISILLDKGIITKEKYLYYRGLDRESRQRIVGLLQRSDPTITNALKEGFKEARHNLVSQNQIQDDEIVSIKKDSMFITKPLKYTTFGNVIFTLRNMYSIMVRVGALEFYQRPTGEESVLMDIKGINDNILKRYHEQSYVLLLSELFKLIQFDKIEEAIGLWINFMKDYDTFQVPLQFYREFNPESKYRVHSVLNSVYYIDDESGLSYDIIDPRYNRAFNREVYRVLIALYTQTRHR